MDQNGGENPPKRKNPSVSGFLPREQTSGEIITHARPPHVFRWRWVFGNDRKHTWFYTVINSNLVRLFRSVPIVSSESISLEGFRVLFSVFLTSTVFSLPGGKFLFFQFFLMPKHAILTRLELAYHRNMSFWRRFHFINLPFLHGGSSPPISGLS